MKYLAAYLLLQQGGVAAPSASEISTLLETVGVEVDSAKLELLLSSLEGKDVNALIAEGASKLASVPSGGAAASGSSGAAASGSSDAAPAEEEKEEEKEESDDEMGFGLFD